VQKISNCRDKIVSKSDAKSSRNHGIALWLLVLKRTIPTERQPPIIMYMKADILASLIVEVALGGDRGVSYRG
jgi:hypothetical protein